MYGWSQSRDEPVAGELFIGTVAASSLEVRHGSAYLTPPWAFTQIISSYESSVYTKQILLWAMMKEDKKNKKHN